MASSKDKEFEIYEDAAIIADGDANSKMYYSAKPLTTYYRKLKDFNYYSGPKEISDKLAEIKKNIKNVKSKMEELSGSTILYETDVVDNLSTIVDDTKNYVDDALTPATKKIKGLKTDLETYYKQTTSSLSSRTGNDKNVVYEDFDYNDNFKSYLSTEGRRLTSIERKIYQQISDIQSESSYNFRTGSGPITSIYPIDPIVAVPDYGVEPTIITAVPMYGVQIPPEVYSAPSYGVIPTTGIHATPKYGVELPTEVYSAPSYGVIPTTGIHATPKYGVELPIEVYSAPSYGVIPTTGIHATPKYGVELPTEITAIPDYGVQLPITGIHATPKYGVELPTEITAIPDYGVQLPITGIHATPKYGVELPTGITAIPDYGVQLPITDLQVQPRYGVQVSTKKTKKK